MRKGRQAVGAALIVAACAGSALAQGGATTDDAAGGTGVAGTDARGVKYSLDLRGLHYFSTDFEGGGDEGDVSVSRFGPIASVVFPVGDVSSLTLSAEYTYSSYDFDGTGLFDDDNGLLDEAHELGLSATWSSRLGGKWTYFVGGGVRWSGESGANFSDAITGRVFGGVGYRASEQWVLGVGVGVSTELDDDVLVVPFLSAYCQINERWSFSAGGGPAAAGRTLGATLTWQATPKLGVSLTGAWDRREFRLDEDGAIEGGIATDSRIDIALGLNWGVADGVRLRLEGGVSAWQEFEFEDEGGDELANPDADVTPFVGASLNFAF